MGELDLANFVSHLVIYMVVLLLAISAHEAGHAWMSYKYGDDTAYLLGRVTLNPVAHTDPIGTLLIPIISFTFGALGGAANIGFPAPTFFAWAAALSEFLGGIFLALGLFTRISSFFIVCVMLTALLGVHLRDPFGKQELAFFYLFIAFAFMLKGASDWSIDSFLRRK